MNKKTLIILTCLCIVIAAMDVSGLPGVLLSIRVADVDPFILPLMVNFCLIGLLAVVVIMRHCLVLALLKARHFKPKQRLTQCMLLCYKQV